jgi:hypothetical protein
MLFRKKLKDAKWEYGSCTDGRTLKLPTEKSLKMPNVNMEAVSRWTDTKITNRKKDKTTNHDLRNTK